MPSDGDDAADDARDDTEPSLRDHPLTLAAIDTLLVVSAEVEQAGTVAPIRRWRDDLTLALEALAYARAILSADVAILRHAGSTWAEQGKSLVDDLPGVLDTAPQGEEPPPPSEYVEAEIDEGLFGRTDELLHSHEEMAEVDLTSAFDVAGSLAVMEEELAALTERQREVEARLQEIRAAVIRGYQEGPGTARDQPA